LINAIIDLAKSEGVSHLYWNSVDTIDSGNTQESKLDFFYERLPKRLGFRSEFVDLRGHDKERMWYLPLTQEVQAQSVDDPVFTLDQIPIGVRAKVQGMLGRVACESCYDAPINHMTEKKRPNKKCKGCRGKGIDHPGPFKKSELVRIFEILKKSEAKKKERRDKENKLMRGFSYDAKGVWHGAQRFTNVKEKIIKQRIKRSTLDQILNRHDPILDKFLSYLLSQGGHFDDDVLGFALVAPISPDTWVINEIQTDSLNAYMNEKSQALGMRDRPAGNKVLDKDVVRDMLTARNKSLWVPKLEDDNFLAKIREDSSLIDRLPDDTALAAAGGLDAWLGSDESNMFNLAHNRIRKIFSHVKRYR
jgi:hypothetical protein